MKFPQDATYWSPSTENKFGERSFGAPILIKVRWEDKVELFKNAEGEETQSSSIVFSKIDLEEKGFLFLGDAIAQSDPLTVGKAFEIKIFEKVPNRRAKKDTRRSLL